MLPIIVALTSTGWALYSDSMESQVDILRQGWSTDLQILDTVLVDVVSYPESFALSLPDKMPRTVFYRLERPDSDLNALEPIERNDWEDAEHLDRAAVESAALNHKDRFEAGDAFASYTPSDKRILQANEDDVIPVGAPYQAHYPVEFSVPGYSSNGKYAIITLYFPEFLHPSFVTYVLERKSKNWKIVLRDGITYL